MPRLLKGGPAGPIRFFIDTCFALNEAAFAALDDSFFSTLRAHQTPLVLPLAVLREIQKHERDPVDLELVKRAKSALVRFAALEQAKAVRMVGSADDPFADQTFLEVFTKFRPKYTLLLFTQDSGLTRDLLQINDHESTNRTRNKIFVARHISKQGIIVFNDREQFVQRFARRQPARASSSHATPNKPKPPAASFKFRICTAPRASDDHIIGDGALYGPRSTVYTNARQPVSLGTSLARGGEGEIFEVDPNRVAKVYFHDRRTRSRRDKLQLMCSHPLAIREVAWPQELLNDAAGNFLGYIMPKARGRPLQHCVFGKSALAEHFPAWKRKDLVELALTYARVVARIHQQGLIVGDVNPMNVLVASCQEIYLVDVDSFQVEDFPCPVGMATFRAPEITEPNFAAFLRNERHEAFAVASLLFMILMGGKPPFSYQGGGDPTENIRNGNFPYVRDRNSIPAGAYRYIWSYFPEQVKNAFGRAFTAKDPANRPTLAEWVDILDRYAKALQQSQNPDSTAIWPRSFKPFGNKSSVQLQCAECSEFFQTTGEDAKRRKSFPKVLCGNCLAALLLAKKAGQNYTCQKCGKLFQVSFDQVQRHDVVLETCEECVASYASQRRVCKDCGRAFSLDHGETRFLLVKGLSMPKRCGPCRGKPEHYAPVPNRHFSFESPKQSAPAPAPAASNTYFNPVKREQPKTLWEKLKSLFE